MVIRVTDRVSLVVRVSFIVVGVLNCEGVRVRGVRVLGC